MKQQGINYQIDFEKPLVNRLIEYECGCVIYREECGCEGFIHFCNSHRPNNTTDTDTHKVFKITTCDKHKEID